jgi:hypothetical protein
MPLYYLVTEIMHSAETGQAFAIAMSGPMLWLFTESPMLQLSN